ARHYGVVTDRYKLVHFYEPAFDYWEMFDLQKDPRELQSVYGKPDYAGAQKELLAELQRLRSELKVPDPNPKEPLTTGKEPCAPNGGSRGSEGLADAPPPEGFGFKSRCQPFHRLGNAFPAKREGFEMDGQEKMRTCVIG